MTTMTAQTTSRSGSLLFSVLAAGFLGLALLTLAGHAQAAALHDAAHDMRHATGFPCH